MWPLLQGQVSGRLPHGHGTYRFANPCFVYEGDFVQGRKQGQGRLTLSDGSVIEAPFVVRKEGGGGE